MTLDPETMLPPGAKIKVIGVGGGGGNAVNTMIRLGVEGVEFIACNTDVQSLRNSLAPRKIQLGKELTKGLGAGADPDTGRDAALEDRHEIQEVLQDADMVFVTAGMGGGTGTGGASVIAQIARELGALTVAVVTKPFSFEGKRRRKHAELGISRLRENVDTLITIPNQRLLQIATPDLSMMDAFRLADQVLVNSVKGISDIINVPGVVNVDFADVKTVMSCMGHALMGIGSASGPNRAVEAAQQAISSPLLEDIDIEGATGVLINVTAGTSVTLMELNEACSIIQEAAHEDANVIFGSVVDEAMGDELRVTVIATGFPVESDDRDVEPRTHSGYATPNVSSRITTSPGTRGQPAFYQPKFVPKVSSYTTTPQPTQASTHAAQQAQQRMGAMATPQQTPMTRPQEPVFTAPPAEQVSPAPSFSPPATPTAHHSVPAFSEAQELTRMTLLEENMPAMAPLSEALPQTAAPMHSEDVPELSFWLSDESSDAPASTPAPTEPMASYGFEEEEVTFKDPDKDFPLDSFFAKPATAAAQASTQTSQPNLASEIVDDIDRKIDEAFELADRLRSNRTGGTSSSSPIDRTTEHRLVTDDGLPQPHLSDDSDEDLEVPAFLRNGMKDLPLR